MNSKEAIQRIKDDFEIKYDNLKNEKDRQNIIGLCEVIKKELEVLEILKNKNVDVNFIKNIMSDRRFECYPYENLTQEEFNKVKEWLKNE